MNKKYKVSYEEENLGSCWLNVTHNGNQWQTIRIDDPRNEIPLIIAELESHLDQIIAQEPIGWMDKVIESAGSLEHTWFCDNCGDCPHVEIDGRVRCWVCGKDNGARE